MGTRSTTKFIERYKDEKGKVKRLTLMNMYRQFDGYPNGHGRDLADFLKDSELVNGLSDTTKKVLNGMGCLAAQVVAHLKEGAENIYITNLKDSQEYNYEIIGHFDTNKLTIVCKAGDEVIFKGSVKEFDKFCG